MASTFEKYLVGEGEPRIGFIKREVEHNTNAVGSLERCESTFVIFGKGGALRNSTVTLAMIFSNTIPLAWFELPSEPRMRPPYRLIKCPSSSRFSLSRSLKLIVEPKRC